MRNEKRSFFNTHPNPPEEREPDYLPPINNCSVRRNAKPPIREALKRHGKAAFERFNFLKILLFNVKFRGGVNVKRIYL